MAQKKTTRRGLMPRKMPLQRRSAETVAVILEGAAHILEERGFEGFNTNAVAARAGVSIGSLYQYFPNKDALLSALIQREVAPLLAVGDQLSRKESFDDALREYIRASIRHQMKRPRLARLIDYAEMREAFHQQVSGTTSRLARALEDILRLHDAPKLRNRSVAAADVLVVIRSLVDAAGERGEGESPALLRRVEGAVMGYLES
jgi:AcrR family transcriptional regulator